MSDAAGTSIITETTGSFWEYLKGTFGIALWLLPVLAWYDWLSSLVRSWTGTEVIVPKDDLKNKFFLAIGLTVVVFLIMWLLRPTTNGKDVVVVDRS